MSVDPPAMELDVHATTSTLAEVRVIYLSIAYAEQYIIQLYDLEGDVLAPWGLQINRHLKALVCLACKAVVLPSAIHKHHLAQHKSSRITVDMAIIKNAVASEGLCEDWPEPPFGVPKQYLGLDVVEGFKCPLPSCSFVAAAFNTLQKHTHKEHSITVSINGRHHKVHLQRYSQQPGGRSFFMVHPLTSAPTFPHHAYLTALRQELDAPANIPAAEVDIRQVNVWQASTRWNQWVATQDVNMLLELIEYPKPDSNLANLTALVHHLLDKVYKFIPIAGELCCQILNTEENTRCCSYLFYICAVLTSS